MRAARKLAWLLAATDTIDTTKKQNLFEGTEYFHLIYDFQAQCYNTPYKYDPEVNVFEKIESAQAESRTPWTLLNNEPHYSRMNTIAKAGMWKVAFFRVNHHY
jgi:hypothetical protein